MSFTAEICKIAKAETCLKDLANTSNDLHLLGNVFPPAIGDFYLGAHIEAIYDHILGLGLGLAFEEAGSILMRHTRNSLR